MHYRYFKRGALLALLALAASHGLSWAQSTLTTQWPGLPSRAQPPDPQAAAGPAGLIQTVNFAIAYFTKAGTFIWGPVNLTTFWSSAGNTGQGMADPKVIFDSGSGRFYVIMQENTAASQSFLNVAVSKSSDPATSGASDWYFYRFNMTETVNGVNYGGDYPGLGVDAQAIYVTYNMYPSCGGCSGGIGSSFFNSQIIVLNKAALNKGTGIFASLFPGGFTLRPATVIGSYSPGNVAYFVEIGDSNTVTISALSDPLGARTFSDVEVSVADFGGSIDCGSGSTASTTTI